MKNLSENQIKSLPEVWRCAGGDALRRSLYPKKVRIKNKPDFILKLNAAIQACVVFDLNGTVYVVDAGGGVTAFSKDGQFVWGAKLDSGVFSSPARHPEKPILYAGTAGGFVYAINTEDGKILWKKQIFTASDPRILSDILYVQQ
ncbi:MAG: PQQ-binding-like beta-propeller repeat protein, partial [Verrucomicrobiae bacterium]|nr:PQQ-binding-like beta-propeller repeat protein [Verrucomicrobiae bacterium]